MHKPESNREQLESPQKCSSRERRETCWIWNQEEIQETLGFWTDGRQNGGETEMEEREHRTGQSGV